MIAANGTMFLEADAKAAATMLAVGFDVATTGKMGETALHWAGFTGMLEKARLLIAHGAPINLRDKNWDSPPLGWCCYGSLQQRAPTSDFPGVARALLEAGAELDPNREDNAADDVGEVIAEFRRARK